MSYIKTTLTHIPFDEISPNLYINLPKSQFKKVLILDMDETLSHCVDDVEKQIPDVILEIDFEGEETLCAGINFRPYLIETLK